MINELILTACSVGGAFGTYYADKALQDKKITVFKRQLGLAGLVSRILALLLFFLYIPHLFGLEVVTKQLGLEGELFSKAGYILVTVLEWITTLTLGAVILLPFFPKKTLHDYCAFFAPVVMLLNIVFLRATVLSILGVKDMLHWRTFVWEGILLLISAISGKELLAKIKEKEFEGLGKRMGNTAIFFAVSLLAFMPQQFPQILLGEIGPVTEDFTLTHRLFIYVSFIAPMAIYFAQRKNSYEDRWFILVYLALSGFIQYFAYHPHRTGASMFPLHLCNTAMVLMLVAYAFKLKPIYYFTYFINVLGAFCAIVLPNLEEATSSMRTMVYWYNHWYAFFLPLLGVALGVWRKENSCALLVGTESGVATMEDSVSILKQLQIELPLAIYSRGLKSGSRRDICPCLL